MLKAKQISADDQLVQAGVSAYSLGFEQLQLAVGTEDHLAPVAQVAGQVGIEGVLRLLDLVGRPGVGHAQIGFRDAAFGEEVQQPQLAAQRQVDQ